MTAEQKAAMREAGKSASDMGLDLSSDKSPASQMLDMLAQQQQGPTQEPQQQEPQQQEPEKFDFSDDNAPEQPQSWQEQIPEKFRSETAEETAIKTARSYTELESEVGRLRAELQDAKRPRPDPPAFPDTPQEAYGKLLGDALENSGVDYRGMHDRFHRYGQLEQSDYAALERLGISPDLFHNALVGQRIQIEAKKQVELQQQETQQQTAETPSLTPDQAQALMREFGGGPEGYRKMAAWAQGNLSEADLTGIDDAIRTGSYAAVRMVLRSVALQFQAARGTEGTMLSGKSPSDSSVGVLDTREKQLAVIDDKRWKTDPEWRARMYAKFR